jgi:raffinose/stachyose/melibiose transport system permease protein
MERIFKMKKMLENKIAIALFAVPALIIFTVFIIASTVRIAIGSAYDWDGILPGTYVGLNNFKRLFTDNIFYTSLKNGLITAAILLISQFVLGLILALVISDKDIKFRKVFRTTYFIPNIVSISVGCLLGIQALLSDGGLINHIIHMMGINYTQSWLSNPKTAVYAVAMVNGWQYLGVYVVLFYSGIKSIPAYYYEAARTDGANKIQTYIHVIIPLLSEVIRYCLLFAMLGGLNQFVHNLSITAGGPGESTYSLNLLMYMKAFGSSDFGYGSAVAVIVVLQSLIVTILINKFVAREKITY